MYRGLNKQFKASGTLAKLLQLGVQVEDDDEEFELAPRKPGQSPMVFTENNMDIDKDTGNYMKEQPKVVDGRRMPTLEEVMADPDFLPELRQNNELLLKL